MHESHTERHVTEYALRHLGVPSTKLGQHGYPDRLFFLPNGYLLMVEFKSPGRQPRPLQQHRINTLRQLGYRVEVHDDPVKAVASLHLHLEAAQISDAVDEISARARERRALLEAWAGEDRSHAWGV